MKCGGTYRQLPDNMKNMQPFVSGLSYIKSAINRAYMAVLFYARRQRNINYSNEDDDSESDDSTVFLDEDM